MKDGVFVVKKCRRIKFNCSVWINNIYDIDKVRTINDGYEVEGAFRLSSSIDEYTFSMTLDANGDIQTYREKGK